MNARKVLIERPVHDEFVERLATKVRGFKSGDPSMPGPVIGPLINDRALRSVEERVQDAVSRGAKLVTGGQAEGRVYAPTILTDVPDAVPINRNTVHLGVQKPHITDRVFWDRQRWRVFLPACQPAFV